MIDQIFAIDAQSIVLRENELWISKEKVEGLYKFEKLLGKSGFMEGAYSIPLESITEVIFNESSENFKIKYVDKSGKERKQNILVFQESSHSNQFANFLGGKLHLTKSIQQEGQLKPILTNLFYIAATIAATIFFGSVDDTSEITDNTSARNKGRGMIAKLVIDTVGQTGVYIIGAIMTLIFLYQLYVRFKNPSNNVIYK